MNTIKLYRTLSVVSIVLGIGMFLGKSLGQGTSNTPLWIGGILIVLGAVLTGMAISTASVEKNTVKEVSDEADSSKN